MRKKLLFFFPGSLVVKTKYPWNFCGHLCHQLEKISWRLRPTDEKVKLLDEEREIKAW